MTTQLKGNFKTYNQGRTYSGAIVNGSVKLQATVYYNGRHDIVENKLINSSVPLSMKDRYIEREGNETYSMAAALLLSN